LKKSKPKWFFSLALIKLKKNQNIENAYTHIYTIITARGSDGSIVFSIVAVFFCLSVNTISHKPLHLA